MSCFRCSVPAIACKTLNIDIDSCGFDKIDTDYWFFRPGNVYRHVWNVSCGEKEIDCELMDFQVMFSQEDLSQCIFFPECAHTFLTIAGSKNWYWQICIYMPLKDPIMHWDANTIAKFKVLRQQGEANAALRLSYKAAYCI